MKKIMFDKFFFHSFVKTRRTLVISLFFFLTNKKIKYIEDLYHTSG